MDVESDDDDDYDKFEARYGELCAGNSIDGATITLYMAGGGAHWWNYVLVFTDEEEYELYIDDTHGRRHLPGKCLVVYQGDFVLCVDNTYELIHEDQMHMSHYSFEEAMEEVMLRQLDEEYQSDSENDDEIEAVTTCCICDNTREGFGNNPAPVKTEGRCCDACNTSVVIPARIQSIVGNQ
jgi:hypothetical protein